MSRRYPEGHEVNTDRALYDYVGELKARFMRSAPPLAKVQYVQKLHIVRNALGTLTQMSGVQGNRLKAEIRVASLFKQAPAPFLKMITEGVTDIDAAIMAESGAGLAAAGHSLRGASGSIGALRIEQMAAGLESLGETDATTRHVAAAARSSQKLLIETVRGLQRDIDLEDEAATSM